MKKHFFVKRKLRSTLTILAFVLSMSVTAFASESSQHELYNVKSEAPVESSIKTNIGEISIKGLSKPSKDSYVNLNTESLTFAGHATGSTLYTNKHFKGKSTINYSITNDCDSKLTVKFYTSKGWFKSKKITVEANATLTGIIDGLDASKLYYLTFSAPSDFSGVIN